MPGLSADFADGVIIVAHLIEEKCMDLSSLAIISGIGMYLSCSHLLTASVLTSSNSANAVWLSPFAFLAFAIRMPSPIRMPPNPLIRNRNVSLAPIILYLAANEKKNK